MEVACERLMMEWEAFGALARKGACDSRIEIQNSRVNYNSGAQYPRGCVQYQNVATCSGGGPSPIKLYEHQSGISLQAETVLQGVKICYKSNSLYCVMEADD